MAIPAHKHVGTGPEAEILSRRRNRGVDRRGRRKRTEGLAELGEKLGGGWLWNGQELAGQAQCGSKNHLGGGEANPFLGSGPEPKQNSGQLLVPRTIDTPGPQGVLHAAVEPLNHPIALGVVGSGLVVCDAKDSTEALPECRDELRPAIGGQMGWNAEPRDPMGQQSVSTGGGRRRGQRNGLRPPSAAVHNREQVFTTAGDWQRTDEVDV